MAGGCLTASPPAPAAVGGTDGGNSGWADAIVALSAGGRGIDCTAGAGLPPCGMPSAACGAEAALGPADGKSFPVGAGGTLLLALRCSYVVDHGGPPDLTIWASVPADT